MCNEKVNIENAIKRPEEMVGKEEDYFLSLEISVVFLQEPYKF